MLEKLIEAISKQQKGKEGTAVFGVGEQLKDICRTTPGTAELVLEDFNNPDMSIADCEKKIKAFADKRHKEVKGNGVFVSPSEADKIIREFYGIPEAEQLPVAPAAPKRSKLNIDDFI